MDAKQQFKLHNVLLQLEKLQKICHKITGFKLHNVLLQFTRAIAVMYEA